MIDLEWKKEFSGNIFVLWIRKFITSIFYYRFYRKLNPDKPWFMPKAVRFLEKKIANIDRVFEYGSGTSSLWFAEHVTEYVAVENDKEWHEYVSEMLRKKQFINATVLYVPENKINSGFDWENDWPYFNILQHPPGKPEFLNYMSTIDQYPDNYFDYIIIDGRERLGCLVHAISKLHDQGVIIFDDSARDTNQQVFEILGDWAYLNFRFGLGRTTFFARNKMILEGN
jgi:hypothetical protein